MSVLTRNNYETDLSGEILNVAKAIVAYGDGDDLIFGKQVSDLGSKTQLINRWLTQEDRIDLGKEVTRSELDETKAKTLLTLADNLVKCVQGDQLAASECQSAITSINTNTIDNLVVPVRVAAKMLKNLGFKAYTVDQHYLSGQQGNRFESVEEWVKRNSTDSLPLGNSSYDNLRNVLGAYVRVANLHPDLWEDGYKSVSVARGFDDDSKISHPIRRKTKDGKVEVTFERFSHDIEAKTEMLAMILPVRWAEAGVIVGGGYVSDNSYVGEIDRMAASGSVFRTAEILKKYLNYYLEQLDNNGVKVEETEKEALKKLADDLERREKSLVQVVSLLEKVLALNKYYGETITGITDTDSLHKIVESNKKIFEKVNKSRAKLMGGIRILLKGL